MRRARLATVAILAALPAASETAVLECVADTVTKGADHGKTLEVDPSGHLLLDFRFSAVEGWKLSQTRLMLHIAGGSAPRRLHASLIVTAWRESDTPPRPSVGTARPVRIQTHPENWISLEIPVELLQPSVDRTAFGVAIHNAAGRALLVHGRESLSWAPYVLAEGSRLERPVRRSPQ